MPDIVMGDSSNNTKKPSIDFSVHTMEDGTVVNTKDRICKSNV